MAAAVAHRYPSVNKPITKAANPTGRSKAACRIPFPTTTPKDPVIVNIDEFDKNNELAEVEYVEDIYKSYKLSETEETLRDYMYFQHDDINPRTRATMLDWLVQVHTQYDLMPETLFLTINIVDRYLWYTIVARTELQLVGISALLISSKYEQKRALRVNDMITMSEYTREQILDMEISILTRLGWYLTVPTSYVFTVRYAKASLPTDSEMENMVFFFTELGLMDYLITIRNNPSMLAASAVYAARCTLNKTPAWTETLKQYTGYTEDQLADCAKSLMSFHASARYNKFKAVYKKYLKPDRDAVARFPPEKSLLVSLGSLLLCIWLVVKLML